MTRTVVAGRVTPIVLAGAILAGLIVVGDPERLASALDGRGAGLVVMALVLYLGNSVLKAVRWWILLRAADPAVSLPQATRAHLVGMAVNNLLPTGLAGEPVRLLQLGGPVTAARIAATGADRALDVVLLAGAGMAAAALSGVVDPAGAPLVPLAAGGAVVVVVAGLAWVWRRTDGGRSLHPPTLGAALALTVVLQANDPIRLMLIAAAYGEQLAFWPAVGIVAAGTLAGTFTVLGAGAGLALSTGTLLVASGVSSPTAAAIGLVFIATSTWASFGLGALAALAGGIVPRREH